MKKEYRKPICYVESFTLTDHISAGCSWVTTFGNACPISEAGETFFTSTDIGCSEGALSMMSFAGIDPATASVEDLSKLNAYCYNSFSEFSSLYVS